MKTTNQQQQIFYKELLLLRHGKSDWHSNESDFYRPLKKRGKKNARQIGLWLAEQQLLPDLLLSSPAVRAVETANQVAEAMGISVHSIPTDKRIYEAGLSDLSQVLSEIPDSVQRLLLVGHNPGLEELLHYLAPGLPIPEDGKMMPTASLAYLKLDQPFKQLFQQKWRSLNGNNLLSYMIQRAKDLPQ